MRRTTFICLILLVLCLTSCTSQPTPSTPTTTVAQPAKSSPAIQNRYVVGVAWQGMTPYVLRLQDWLLEFADDAPFEIEFMMMDAQENYEKQISQVENFIAHKVDLILLNPCSYEHLDPAVEAAQNADIPIITIITRIKNQDQCIAFVGSDHKESATLEFELAAEKLNNKGKIVILQGTVGIEAQLLRSEGYKERLAAYPDIEVAAEQPAFWQRDEAYMIVENWIYNGLEFDAILSQNDYMALGALDAVRAAGKEDEIIVLGIDGDSNAISAVENGQLTGTIYMDAYTQAWQIAECIQMIHDNVTPQREYLIPFIVVTDSTVNDPLIREQIMR